MSAASAKRPRRPVTQLTWSQNQGHRARTAPDENDIIAAPKGMGYTVLSYLIAGMAAYGGIGWLIGRAVHISLLFPIGMLVGLVISLGWIVYHYGFKGGGQ